ncbi:MAG: hypothetical protein IKK44_01215, partial [Clostridium sp.]|nr:hypothetical protein [Clostridium sp.]
MSDRDKIQSNNEDDLSEFRALVGDADSSGDFALDDILAEYGIRRDTEPSTVPMEPDLPWPEAKRTRHTEDNVVPFPSLFQPEPEEPEETEDDVPDLSPAESDCPEIDEDEDVPEDLPEPTDGEDTPIPEDLPPTHTPSDEDTSTSTVIPFPTRKTGLSALFQRVLNRANTHADGMFEESERTDPEEVRRLEELIPGTDQETPPKQARRRSQREPEPPPPDRPLQDLAREYGHGLKGMRLRVILLFFLCLPAIAQLVVPAIGYPWPAPLDLYQIQIGISAALLFLGVLLAADVLLAGITRAVQGRMGMDTMLFLAACFTLADALRLLFFQDRAGQLPCCAVVLVGLFFQLHGYYHKRCALRLACRTAAISAHPYRVTQDEKVWSGRDTYAKHSGTPEGFGSQIQVDDGAQQFYRKFCPILAAACLIVVLP